MSKPSTATTSQTSLDQLELVVNQVLTQTGRLFGEAAKGNKVGVAAHSSRLKQFLPRATMAFHEALDQLENELALAKAVLRRDLAQCGVQQSGEVQGEMTAVNKDVVMLDGQSDDADTTTGTAAATETKVEATQNHAHTSESREPREENVPSSTELGSSVTLKDDSQQDAQPDAQPDEMRPESGSNAASAIDLDTPDEQVDAPAVAPTSVPGPMHQAEAVQPTAQTAEPTTGDATKKSTPADESLVSVSETDQFEDSGGDNLASLLPGLESYANGSGLDMSQFASDNSRPVTATATAEGGAEDAAGVDFGASDATLGMSSAPAQASSSGTQQQEQQPQDMPFEDLMDFADFDMSGIVGAGGEEEGDDGGMRYDDSFFSLE